MSTRQGTAVAAFILIGLLLSAVSSIAQQGAGKPHTSDPVLITSPVSQSAQAPHGPFKNPKEKPLGRPHDAAHSRDLTDPAVQTFTSTPAAAQSLVQWEGLGVGMGGFLPTAVPPAPNLAVGPNHIVQWVNNSLVIFDK